MAVEYLGLSEINGPLVVLEGVQGAAYDEIVEMTVGGTTKKIGRIIEIYGDKAIIQVFEGTDGMALRNTHTRLTGHPMEIAVSEEMLGRTFNGIGQPIDGLGDIISDIRMDINGQPLNPVSREYPRNYIRTGISAIDGLTTLIRGQKLPIFSGNGLPHDQLAAQIVQQASLGDNSDEKFALVLSDAKAQVSYDYDTGRITTFLISTQHQEDTSVMDIRPLVEAVMETAGKIKNDNMSDQDFYKLIREQSASGQRKKLLTIF
mgnify:FL=1